MLSARRSAPRFFFGGGVVVGRAGGCLGSLYLLRLPRLTSQRMYLLPSVKRLLLGKKKGGGGVFGY